MTEKSRRLPLEGLKVLDFSWVFTGPITTRMLADNGATVIKVEGASHPDMARGVSPFIDKKPGLNRAYHFSGNNEGKLSLTLNLAKPEGAKIAKRLVAWADVLIDTFGPGTIGKLGMGYEQSRAINPGLIMVSATMQGQDGPFSTQPTFGAFFQSTMGFSDILGWPDRLPSMPPGAYSDFITPWVILVGIITALDHRRKTGEGQYLDVSQLESSVHLLTPALLELQANGRVAKRNGNRSEEAAPHGVFRCAGKERFCAISVNTDEQWGSLCKVLGEPSWTQEPSLGTFQGRKKREDEVSKLIEQWTSTRSPHDVMELLQAANIPAGVVSNGKDLWEDPQLKYRQHFQMMKNPDGGSFPCDLASFRLSETPPVVQDHYPELGQDNHYVCTEVLGMSDGEFAELYSTGVFN